MQLTGVGNIKINKKIKNKEHKLKIATFRRGGLGDGFIQSAITASIKKHFPDADITAYSDTTFTNIFHGAQYCNRIVPVEWKRGLITEIDVRNFFLSLHDLWFDLKPLQFIEGSKSSNFISEEKKNRLRDIESRYYYFNGRELEDFYKEMDAIGQTQLFSKIFNIEASMSNAHLNEQNLDGFDRPKKYAVISAGWTDTSFYKSWPSGKWDQIALFLNKNGICPIQIGKSSEPLIHGCVLATHLSLNQQYTLIKESSLFLGSDGFLTHVAAKYNIPSVVLWGITPWRVWGHPGQYNVISPKFDCLWWSYYNWAHDHKCSEIMDAIEVEQVQEKIQEVINAEN